MADVQKGRVLTVSDGRVRVSSCIDSGRVSMFLAIPDRLNGMLSKNTEVAYAVFGDGTGVIIGRIDGREADCK